MMGAPGRTSVFCPPDAISRVPVACPIGQPLGGSGLLLGDLQGFAGLVHEHETLHSDAVGLPLGRASSGLPLRGLSPCKAPRIDVVTPADRWEN